MVTWRLPAYENIILADLKLSMLKVEMSTELQSGILKCPVCLLW